MKLVLGEWTHTCAILSFAATTRLHRTWFDPWFIQPVYCTIKGWSKFDLTIIPIPLGVFCTKCSPDKELPLMISSQLSCDPEGPAEACSSLTLSLRALAHRGDPGLSTTFLLSLNLSFQVDSLCNCCVPKEVVFKLSSFPGSPMEGGARWWRTKHSWAAGACSPMGLTH